MAESRRIMYDDEDNEIYNKLKTQKVFDKNKQNIDLFSLSVIYGKKNNIQGNFGQGNVGRIRESTINSKPLKYIMMAIAVEDTGSMEILVDENEYFPISEKYAKGGLGILQSEIISKGNDILEDMEIEMIEYYDSKKLDE
ncbi:hypothetical protein [Methanobrevibacter curvatus]|uniref:Uncharacterized protein n=1 Tax=Methanobrevibacter curvatus TaxID=49547 RepID=A0A162F755_9EURY|nr:hypothetical protein [Methanobrevibacter curvatus]KZX12816.1 hypothetical protein MBCUR_08720 [Methanobrevibacter curvatus]